MSIWSSTFNPEWRDKDNYSGEAVGSVLFTDLAISYGTRTVRVSIGPNILSTREARELACELLKAADAEDAACDKHEEVRALSRIHNPNSRRQRQKEHKS